MKKWLLASALLVSPAAWSADVFVGAHGGLLGLGAEVGVDFGKVRVRGQLNRFDISESNTYDGASYDVSLDLDSTGVLLDFSPFDGKFYVTAGMYNNGIAISGDTAPGIYQVGNDASPTVRRLFVDVDFDDTAPYAGVGWRFFNGSGNSGLGLSLDLGAYMNGSPNVEIRTDDNAISQTDIDQEERNIENDIDEADVLPVVKLGLSWYF